MTDVQNVPIRLEAAIRELLPFAIPPVEVQFKNVNYIARRKTASGLADRKKPSIGSMILLVLSYITGVSLVMSFFKKRKVLERHILKDVNLIFKPGEMTLVIGPPSSGKTVLLRAIAGDLTLDRQNVLCGNIYLGEVPDGSERSKREVVTYIPQTDGHLAQLTVLETMQFAFDSLQGGTHSTCLVSDKELTPEQTSLLHMLDRCGYRLQSVLRILGLYGVKDSRVGDASYPGISGGEKGRLTLGELLMGSKSVLALDSITDGLDSFTTNHIIESLQEVTKEFQRTAIVVLNQPPPEAYKQFDNLVILGVGGRVVYSGPRTSALAYFKGLGFECPERVDEADFLAKIVWTAVENNETPGVEPLTTFELKERWDKSVQGAALKKAIIKSSPSKNVELAQINERKYVGTWTYHFMKCLNRETTVFMRAKQEFGEYLVLSIIVALMGGAAFYQTDVRFVDGIGWALLFTTIFPVAISNRLISISFQRRVLVAKQLGQNFYPSTAYFLPFIGWLAMRNIVVDAFFLPTCYYMIGLTSQANVFFLFAIMLLGLQLCLSGIVQFIAVVTPNASIGTALSSAVLLICILFSGMFVKIDQLPSALIWIPYLSPTMYTLKAVLINEFSSSRYEICQLDPDTGECVVPAGPTVQQYAFARFGLPTSETSRRYWLWGGLVSWRFGFGKKCNAKYGRE